ncbi:MAG TPA: diacylglycerol kinase family protein [Bacteroidales bacterium]|nr:diacylglycerol kinase family protein [Bacteroidales bacterium]
MPEESTHVNEKFVFIINPVAGTKQKNTISDAIKKAFAHCDYEIIYTQYQGHAFEIATEKIRNGIINIIAVGGDGTINEVASALVKTPARLGIIPVGSGNGLARHLKIPVIVAEAIKVIANPRIKVIDVGRVNGHYFFCTCGTGFDASVGKQFANEGKRGMITYVKTTIHQYMNYSPKKYILKVEDKKVELKAFLVTFANSGQYGNNAYIAPNAQIDDGFLDLCVLRPFPKTSTIEMGLRLFFKNIDQSPYLEVMRVKEATLKRKNKQKISMHLDGEPVTLKRKLKVKVVPQGLQVMVPAAGRKKLMVPDFSLRSK